MLYKTNGSIVHKSSDAKVRHCRHLMRVMSPPGRSVSADNFIAIHDNKRRYSTNKLHFKTSSSKYFSIHYVFTNEAVKSVLFLQ